MKVQMDSPVQHERGYLYMTIDDRLAYSIKETCQLIGLGKTKTQALINSGDLRVKRIGRRTLVLAESIRALLSTED